MAPTTPPAEGGMDSKSLHKYKNSMLTGDQDLGDFFVEEVGAGASVRFKPSF